MTAGFDRVAPYYDDTRGLPESTMAALTDRLAEGLGPAEDVLEIGVGTGRVAMPLSERGYSMTGIDVSLKMLAVLEAKDSDVKARVADAADLPFGDASFDAVLAVDFFHLVAEWRHVIVEAVRVLRPGGRIVVGTFEVLDDPTTRLQQRILQPAGSRPRLAGIATRDVMADLGARFGAAIAELPAVPHARTTSLAGELEALRMGTWSRYWGMPEELRHNIADDIENELCEGGEDLVEPLDIRIELLVLTATV